MYVWKDHSLPQLGPPHRGWLTPTCRWTRPAADGPLHLWEAARFWFFIGVRVAARGRASGQVGALHSPYSHRPKATAKHSNSEKCYEVYTYIWYTVYVYNNLICIWMRSRGTRCREWSSSASLTRFIDDYYYLWTCTVNLYAAGAHDLVWERGGPKFTKRRSWRLVIEMLKAVTCSIYSSRNNPTQCRNACYQ